MCATLRWSFKRSFEQPVLNAKSLFSYRQDGIEAMDAIKGGNRVLRVKTERNGRDAITVAVEDTGPGIDPKKLDGIFEAFVTTKPQGNVPTVGGELIE
jgi:nitrogen fixation/metabolism regulation signal transduction histidine kinase